MSARRLPPFPLALSFSVAPIAPMRYLECLPRASPKESP